MARLSGSLYQTYEFKEVAPGVFAADTCCTWYRNFGRCNRQTFSKCNRLFLKKELKSWGKRHGVEIKPEDIERLL